LSKALNAKLEYYKDLDSDLMETGLLDQIKTQEQQLRTTRVVAKEPYEMTKANGRQGKMNYPH